jgi:hypothetical protein
MTPEQYLRLQELSAKLTDTVLFDADPDNWIGKGIAPKDLSQQQRGDAYWCRKLAVSSLSVLTRVTDLIQKQRNAGNGAAVVTDEESTLDAEINAAEKEAAKLLDKLNRRSKKGEFDKRVHGKS